MMEMVVRIRSAEDDDAAAINRIYNALIDTATVAWTETPEPLGHRVAWMRDQVRLENPVLVAVDDGDDGGGDAPVVIGFASYGDFRDSVKWPGYRFTVEHTVHVDEAHHGKGVGRALLDALKEQARQAGKHMMIAAVDSENEGSIRFHEQLGFEESGRLSETGFKFDRWLTVVFLQCRLAEPQ
jgi:L-amino acid N-acyltransferase YncA